jgi:hypothetical protein
MSPIFWKSLELILRAEYRLSFVDVLMGSRDVFLSGDRQILFSEELRFDERSHPGNSVRSFST